MFKLEIICNDIIQYVNLKFLRIRNKRLQRSNSILLVNYKLFASNQSRLPMVVRTVLAKKTAWRTLHLSVTMGGKSDSM